ncbi:MAG TPA: SDR family NAD(P)-dependent oxidoreductase [Acidimicrobiia bacterium]|nr:SDR family NAD(P)-dependent oxidoreductase [Acidimicrobiia bacterium]
MTEFSERYGPWALVAGASMGIGRAFSHEAARRGLNVVMMARGEALLRETAAEVSNEHGVETRPLVADLERADIGDVVADATRELDVGLFVYNAAIAMHGRFLDVPLADQLASVTVNCATPIILCNLLARRMVNRGRGGIVMVSSNGGIAGAINFGTYNAGKAFEWILAETLWTELGEQGVDVTTIMVGPTLSPNYAAFQATLDPALAGGRDSDDPLERARARLLAASPPEDVAVTSYDALGNGQPVCFSHPDDEMIFRGTLALPRDEAVAVWRGVQETSTRTPDRIAR